MSVALATDARGDLSSLLDPALRPVPLPQALEMIKSLPALYQPRAEAQAALRLASAAFIEHRQEFRPHLISLLGTAPVQEIEEALRVPSSPMERESMTSPNQETLREIIYNRYPRPDFSTEESRGGGGRSRRPRSPRRPRATPTPAPSELSQSPLATGPESKLDLRTLTTTVEIPSKSNLPFARLARFLDPQEWSKSPFWPECYRVDLKDHTFTPHPLPLQTASPFTSWNGYLYEHVEWNWNLSTISSFRNYLTIDYVVDEPGKEITLTFSLYACEGSQLYAMESRRGVDVDWGFQRVSPAHPDESKPWELHTQKNVRFSDILNRRTAFEGPAGSGQLLSYLAPAIVGLWMNDLLTHLDMLDM